MDRISLLRKYIEKCVCADMRSVYETLDHTQSEICQIVAVMRDLYKLQTGIDTFHAQSGADMARVILKRLKCFTDEERILICGEIYRHEDENGVSASVVGNKKAALADIVQRLAEKQVTGALDDADFVQIMRYWPEENAYDELKNAWCGAFVYHVCQEAGFLLPIRHPVCAYRFAGVGAWLQWARHGGFYFSETADFTPYRGDILIYDHIIVPDKKPKDAQWHDHIGIVMSLEENSLLVAEGNCENDNVAGFRSRERGVNIGGYIRIPETYRFDGTEFTFGRCALD